MTAAIYAKRANLNVLIVEKEYEGTGQMAESSRIDNYPGFYGINGYELGEKIREHAESLEVEFLEDEATVLNQMKMDFGNTGKWNKAGNKNSDLYSRSVTQKIECFRK